MGIVIIAVILLVAAFIAIFVGKAFIGKEGEVRKSWTVDSTEALSKNEELKVSMNRIDAESALEVIQPVPFEIEEEDFTFYDKEVQERLEQSIELYKQAKKWNLNNPLAILNPYGTGSNGLYFYFKSTFETKVNYTIHVDDERIPDYSATALHSNGKKYSRNHEFQLIGLVPGEKNHVTIDLVGHLGRTMQSLSFDIQMPENHSNYATILEYEDLGSEAPMAQGLFTMMRTNGYLGYGMMFDDAGVMRYEMVLEGYGLDRILFQNDEIITCVSNKKIARMNGLGQVLQVYELDGYELHHDIQFSTEGKIVALVNKLSSDTIEDTVVEIDLTSGEVVELLDTSVLMEDYHKGQTRPIAPTDDFFWQVGEWDWIHINTIDYMAENDSLLLSSRETNTIIKVEDVHTAPTVRWLIGEEEFWKDTNYKDSVLEKVGDFVCQYGQHTVEFHEQGEDGCYYIRLYNNNYYSLNSRDFKMEVADSVGTDLYGAEGIYSYVYVYRIDENKGTYELAQSFAVPYSSIVSNVQPTAEKNWIVNSGVANVFGEYDAEGNLIREFSYDCDLQGYRTMKYTYQGYWFQ